MKFTMKNFAATTNYPLDIFGGALKPWLFFNTFGRSFPDTTCPLSRELITCVGYSNGHRF
ncbi:MAG: hypothetical protein LBB26_03680 [Puniceicoccales bacterium]|nr:hypothetical protein [Puniceicoccales bacterium]